MTINEAQDAVIEEFEDFTDWMDKYQMLIDLGNELEPLDEKYKNEQNLIDLQEAMIPVEHAQKVQIRIQAEAIFKTMHTI